MHDINELYFNTLLEKSKITQAKDLVLKQPEVDIDSNIIPLAIANDEDLQSIHVQNYEELENSASEKAGEYTYSVLKMQAGLGTSVKREDLIKAIENRSELGAKGTDLYFEVEGKMLPIAELQLRQAIELSKTSPFKAIKYFNLVNDETQNSVKRIWDHSYSGKTYSELFDKNEKLEKGKTFSQKKMQTLDANGELTSERLAPAGHGFIGFSQVLDVFTRDIQNEVIAIGNGEDLSSTPDISVINWVVENDLPIVMITTTKTEADKKGGQISIVKNVDAPDYITIVEKAQAEASNQLTYFEELGLRAGDRESLFNTNVVVINKKALKEIFNEVISDIKTEDFIKSFAPDVIRNVKEQDGKKFTQLESALGSVMLNLDKFFRTVHRKSLVSFLNYAPENREKIFMPIKKREDYEEIKSKFKVSSEYRLERI